MNATDLVEKQPSHRITGDEHWADKNGVRLFLWRKSDDSRTRSRGTILFVHGSSMASQPTFDLTVPGRTDASAMDWFAAEGFTTWSVDMEGYGRSEPVPEICTGR